MSSTVEACVVCAGSLAGRRKGAVTCSGECRVEWNRIRARKRTRKAPAVELVPVWRADGQVDWPEVMRRIRDSAGSRSAAMFTQELNKHRRLNGRSEVRL